MGLSRRSDFKALGKLGVGDLGFKDVALVLVVVLVVLVAGSIEMKTAMINEAVEASLDETPKHAF